MHLDAEFTVEGDTRLNTWYAQVGYNITITDKHDVSREWCTNSVYNLACLVRCSTCRYPTMRSRLPSFST